MVTKAKGERKGALLLHGGNDSYYEELFFPMLYLAENGFDVYLYEGPGQGGVLRLQEMKFTHKWEKPTKAVLNYFKLNGVTIVGASLGGYLAPVQQRLTSVSSELSAGRYSLISLTL
jgi:alpha-beta hydrolase superfamily lysophospholipase